MKADSCEYEEAVTAALISGQWSAALHEHTGSCSHCADLLLIRQYLNSMDTRAEEAAPLPAPGLIWWRSQLAERRCHRARAVAAIDLMQKLALAVALICAVTCAAIWQPKEWNTVLLGGALLVSTAAVLYGWVRGRI